MNNFTFEKCDIEGLYVITPKVYGDQRGYFMETYQYEDFKEAGISENFIQDNQSMSGKGVLRGLHFQKEHPQGKLVRAFAGELYDVAVDLRKDSPTYGKYYGTILSEENKKMLYVPAGFAHGFLVLSETTVFSYKCTDLYHPEDEGGIRWDDPDIGIDWPIREDMTLLFSDKDTKYPGIKECGFSFKL